MLLTLQIIYMYIKLDTDTKYSNLEIPKIKSMYEFLSIQYKTQNMENWNTLTNNI